MAKQDKKLIEVLKKELKHYEVYGKAKRAEEVKKAIKAAGGKVETKTTKPKSEKKVEKKK
jgi:predicted SprT family Zn-dependent metalloprotease